ncbi:MAG: NADH:flavin oxidoreductase/NADH oxidase [Truepera sp.]|nr:NADH:flavin oxidoreductase/NADH oxidase [Truepera sp.]
MSHLFAPLALRDLKLRNRIALSPMCQYSASEGLANDWHLVHLGGRAVGGVGLIISEATAVEARGRISPFDLGLWDDRQVEALRPLTRLIREHGAAPAVQLAHAGRKAGMPRPWDGRYGALSPSEGGWPVVGPTAEPFSADYSEPQALSEAGIAQITQAFADAAVRAVAAGYAAIELHAAHGYLLHSFLSPLSNTRQDGYGGGFAQRTRFLREVTVAVRTVIPTGMPLLVRLSATDWQEGGWTLDDSVRLAIDLKDLGVDLIDCSSGGVVPGVAIPTEPGYQVHLAEAVKQRAGVLSGAVGLITEAEQAEAIVRDGKADLVLLGRALLRDPYWPLQAAQALGVSLKELVPPQYWRAF